MPVAKSKDLYDILGVKDTASDDEIKRAYRGLAKKFHPDATGGDKPKESRFKDVSAAYEILSDAKKRAQYDQMKRGGFDFGDVAAAQGGMPFDVGGFGNAAGFEDLFGQIFGAARARAGRGAGGGGRTRVVFERGFGSGRVEPRSDTLEEAVRDGEGNVYTRRGDDLFHGVEVSFEEATLGAKISVPTPDGRVNVTLPPGSSSGRRLRLRGKGAPLETGTRGDLYAVIKIIVPETVDEKTADLIREVSRRTPIKPRR